LYCFSNEENLKPSNIRTWTQQNLAKLKKEHENQTQIVCACKELQPN